MNFWSWLLKKFYLNAIDFVNSLFFGVIIFTFGIVFLMIGLLLFAWYFFVVGVIFSSPLIISVFLNYYSEYRKLKKEGKLDD